jgi:NFACT protein C-terminal domain
LEFASDQPVKEEAGQAGDPDSDTETVPAASDLEALNSLTGIPITEDELLFAVPVIAPYNTLVNYK